MKAIETKTTPFPQSVCAGFSIQFIHWYVWQQLLLLTAFPIFSTTNMQMSSQFSRRLTWRSLSHFMCFRDWGWFYIFWYIWQIAKGLRPLILGFILCTSHSRTFSMLNGYGAPLQIYRHLEYHEDTGPGKDLTICSLSRFLVYKQHF